MDNNESNSAYSEFWSDNLQRIESTHKNLENSIYELEKKYSDFKPDYNNIEELAELLLSIYKDLQYLPGYEEIKELKELLAYYNKRYSQKALDFEHINKLVINIGEKLNTNFAEFPQINHTKAGSQNFTINEKINSHKYTYKWITFQRNKSWFIVPFNKIKIIYRDEFQLYPIEHSDIVKIKYNNKTIKAVDLFSRNTSNLQEPFFCIITDNKMHIYIAEKIGKKIYSQNDIMKPILKKFKKIKNSHLSPGRVKIFGINHIYLS